MHSNMIKTIAAFGAMAILSGCGGGGIAESQQSVPEGLFVGTDSANRNQVVFVTSASLGSLMYTFYTSGSPAALAGGIHGSLVYSGGTITTSPLYDLNISAKTSTTPAVTGSYTTGQNLALTFVYPDNSQITFSGNYDTGYQGIQNIATLAGKYRGTIGSLGNTDQATFTIGLDGTVTGSGDQGCTYRGSAYPLGKGNGYNISLTTGPAPCAIVAQTTGGLAYLDVAKKTLYFLAPIGTNQGDGLVFKGTLQ